MKMENDRDFNTVIKHVVGRFNAKPCKPKRLSDKFPEMQAAGDILTRLGRQIKTDSPKLHLKIAAALLSTCEEVLKGEHDADPYDYIDEGDPVTEEIQTDMDEVTLDNVADAAHDVIENLT